MKYIDDLELRQDIEKQLNKLESSNKFAKAIFFANNQEIQHETKEDQIKAESCKRLIGNVIICWNTLFLSNLIYDTKNEEQKQKIIRTIKNGSVVAWKHINLQGEYNFSDDALKNSYNFSFPKLRDLEVG